MELPVVHELGGYATVQRAADLMGVTQGAIRDHLYRGNLKGIRIDGRTVMVDKRSLRRLIRYRERRRAEHAGGERQECSAA